MDWNNTQRPDSSETLILHFCWSSFKFHLPQMFQMLFFLFTLTKVTPLICFNKGIEFSSITFYYLVLFSIISLLFCFANFIFKN